MFFHWGGGVNRIAIRKWADNKTQKQLSDPPPPKTFLACNPRARDSRMLVSHEPCFGNRAACYRIEKRGTPESSWGGCWEQCCENSGCCRECWRGCCSSFLSKENPLAAFSPALPAAPRIFAALFPAPSPATFWGSSFLYSVEGRPVPKPCFPTKLLAEKTNSCKISL